MRTFAAAALLLVSGCSLAVARHVDPVAPVLADTSSDYCSGASVTAVMDSVGVGLMSLTGLVGVPMAAGVSVFGDEPIDKKDFVTTELIVGGITAVYALSAAWGFHVAADCRDDRRAYRATHPAAAAPAAVSAPTTPTLPGPPNR